jgi:integrase/recombinase XerD
MAEAGLRVNEASHLDLADVKWDLGRFGKLHVRMGNGARGSGPRERMVPLINGAGVTLRWFIEDAWCRFDDDHARPGVPLFCSERRNTDGSAARVGNETLRSTLAAAAAVHLPDWPPGSPRMSCGISAPRSFYLGAGWTWWRSSRPLVMPGSPPTMNYIHVHATHVEGAWITGQQRAAGRLKGLGP